MDPKGAGRQDDNQVERFHFLPGLTSLGDYDANGDINDSVVASEVMGIVFVLTQTSAEIYQLVADLAEELQGLLANNTSKRHKKFQEFLTTLQEIDSTTQNSDHQMRLLESKIVSSHPGIFVAFVEYSWAALATFKEVSGNLAGIISADAGPRFAVTAAETLIKVKETLETCSNEISGLHRHGYRLLVSSGNCL